MEISLEVMAILVAWWISLGTKTGCFRSFGLFSEALEEIWAGNQPTAASPASREAPMKIFGS